jgi:hypothetical protein
LCFVCDAAADVPCPIVVHARQLTSAMATASLKLKTWQVYADAEVGVRMLPPNCQVSSTGTLVCGSLPVPERNSH